MKKAYVIFTSAILLTLTFTGCVPKRNIDVNSNSPSQETNKENKSVSVQAEASKYSPSDFLPNKLNLKLSYDGGFENAGEQRYTEYMDNNRIQLKTVNAGATSIRILESKEDSLLSIYSQESMNYKENLLSKNSNINEILLKAPIAVGTSWKGDNDATSTITAVDMDLNTKAGNFKVVEVTKKGKDFVQKDYFSKGLGLIKTIFQSNGSDFITEIKSIEENSPLLISYRYFYYDVVNDKNLYKEASSPQQEEAQFKTSLEENLRKVPSNNLIALKSSIKINKIELNKDKPLVHIDFSSNFVKDMNLGSGPETFFLQSIVNTLGYNYGVSDVMITLEGKPYSSGHILMKNGETFKVGYENSVKIK